MTSLELQSIIDETHYWDLDLYDLTISEFCDNVTIKYYSEQLITCNFMKCYKISFNHCLQYDKGMKELSPCFLRDITFSEKHEENKLLFHTIIDAYPIKLEVWCEKIIIKQSDESESE